MNTRRERRGRSMHRWLRSQPAIWLFLFLAGPALAFPGKLGDLDGDGHITIQDVVRLINHLNGSVPLPPDLQVVADVNQDGMINDTDAALIAQAAVGDGVLPEVPLLRVRETSPLNGESGVAVTRETVFYLTEPLAASAVIRTNDLYAVVAGRRLLSRAEVSSDRKTVTLFYLEPVPGGARVRVTFDGSSLTDFLGRPVDLDGDGVPGGVVTVDFDTLSLTPIPNTSVFGRVFASQLQAVPGSTNQFVNTPLAGVTITVDGQEESMRVVTDSFGNFRLEPVPGGQFFVHIDGRTVTNLAAGIHWPDQAYYPVVGKRWEAVAQQETAIGEIYLPLIPAGTLHAASLTNTTELTFTPGFIAQNPQFAGVSITVPPDDIYSENGSRGGRIGIAPVPPSRLPGPLPSGLPILDVVTIQTDGPANFDRPVAACFPNLLGLAPGARTALWSFDHDTGNWTIEGSMTVSADGQVACTDPGVGILAPGWHGTRPGTEGDGGNLLVGGGAETPYEKGTESRVPACPCAGGPCPKPKDPNVDPVYLFSGEFYDEVVDLRIKGRGVDFVWSRKYRSKVGPRTRQGNGWDSGYNVFLQQQGADLQLFDGNSRSDLYSRRPDGTWSRREFFREIVQNPDASFTLTFEDGGSWTFNAFDGSAAAGRLSSSQDRNGNRLRLAYDAQGRLSRITDTLDRDIVVAYNGDDLIAAVTDFAGRVVRYEYYDGVEPGGGKGDLKSVSTPVVTGTPNGNDFPNGKTTTYTYSTGFADDRLNHNLLTITDGRRNDPGDPTFGQGPYLVNVYASTTDPADPNFDRVIRQIWGGAAVDLVYVPLVPSGANHNAVMKTIVRDRVGNVKEYAFDNRNRAVLLREYTGRADPTQPTTELSNRPSGKLRSGDPDYFETRYEWNDDSLMTRTLHPNGNITENVYESDLNPQAPVRSRGNLRIARRLPGTIVSPGAPPVIEETYEYDTEFGGGCCGFNFVTRHVDGRGNAQTFAYDARGNRIRRQDAVPGMIEEWEYNAFGQPIADVLPDDGQGRRRRDEFTYYDTGAQRGFLAQRIVDANGLKLTTTFEYDAVGNLVRVVDPRGHDQLFVVNALDQIVRETTAETTDGSGIRYHRDYFYDANNNIVRRDVQNLDRLGVASTNAYFTDRYEYEVLNHLVQESREVDEGHSVVTQHGYDANRNLVRLVAGEATSGRQPDNVVEFAHDERDLLLREIRAPGSSLQSSTRYDYDGNRNLIRMTQGLEDAPRVTLYTFDGYDRRTAVVDPMGNEKDFAYDEAHNVVNVRSLGELRDDPGNSANVRLQETSAAYDAGNRMTRIATGFFEARTQAALLGGTMTMDFTYNGLSQVTGFTDANGHQTTPGYDTANRRATVTDAAGNSVAYTYDANDNVITETRTELPTLGGPAEVFIVQRSYDNLNRLLQVMNDAGGAVDYAYDSRDNLVRMEDARRTGPTQPGNATEWVYDGLNRKVQTTRFLTATGLGGGAGTGSIVTQEGWDDSSRLVRQIDANGHATVYEHDPLDRLTRTLFADGTQETTGYDVHHNRIRLANAAGTVVTNSYDLDDRLTRKDVQPGPGVASTTTFEAFVYDGLSRAVRAENDASVVQRSYDSLSHVIEEDLNGQVSRQQYDGLGNLLSSVYPGGRTLTRSYDEVNRLRTVSEGGQVLASFDFTGPERLVRRTLVNGTRSTYGYDGLSGVANAPGDLGYRLVSSVVHDRVSDHAVLDQRAYLRDGMGNRVGQTEQLPEAAQRQFGYDSAGRLVRSDYTPAALPLETTGFTWDGAGNRQHVEGGPFGGDYLMSAQTPEPADFQMNQITSTPFDLRQYDANGNLTGIQSATTQRQLVYDYQDRLVAHTDSQTGQQIIYTYDAFGRRIGRQAGATPGASTRFFYTGWEVTEEQDGAGAAVATYVHGRQPDELVSFRRAGNDLFLLSDDLLNIVGVTDGQGRLVESYEYSDFGAPRVFDAAGTEVAGSRVNNNRLFVGREYDAATGLYYFRARHFDPAAGAFVSRDPVGLWGDPMNLGNGASYVGNNPRTLADPSGLFTITYGFSWGGWSGSDDWKRTQVKNYMDLIKMRIDKYILPALTAELSLRMSEICPNSTPQDFLWITRVATLLQSMGQLSTDIGGTADIKFKLKNLGDEVAAQALFYPFVGTPTGTIELNDGSNPKMNFFAVSQEEAVATLFHELSHLYGTEDNGPALQNAHNLESRFKMLSNPGPNNNPFATWLQTQRGFCRRGIGE